MDEIGEYLHRIGQHQLLTAADETNLAIVIAKGRAIQSAKPDPAGRTVADRRTIRLADQAAERFWLSNLRLAYIIASRYSRPPGMELMDLVQEANIALKTAVEKFDWRKGFKFSTYATWWIRQSIGRAMDNSGTTIRLPGDQAAALRAALKRTGGDPGKLDPKMRELYELTSTLSLNAPTGMDPTGSSELQDMIPDASRGVGDQVELLSRSEFFRKKLADMDPVTAYIIGRKFGFDDAPVSHRVIGEELASLPGGVYLTSEAIRMRVLRGLAQMASSPDLVEWADGHGAPAPRISKELDRQAKLAQQRLNEQLSLPIG